MTRLPLSLAASLLLFSTLCKAQPGAVNPPLLACGQQGDATVVCGTRAPEDFEVTPDGNYLIVANFGQGADPSLDLFNLATQEFTPIALADARQQGWGQSSCNESIGAKVNPHGLSLSQRTGGAWQLYIVNHAVRESMEMYELQQDGAAWKLVWRGCVMADKPYNDVAALPDGSFVATRPQALQQQGQDLFAGGVSGNVAVWTAATGETVLPGSEYGYPNGVVVSKDGRYAYVSGWTTRSVHQYDLRDKEEVKRSAFTFMPDNLTWSPDGKLLAAGIKGVNGNCPAASTNPCIQGFGIAVVDPVTLAVDEIYDNKGAALINGVSVAIEAKGSIYVGSFQGDRLVKVPR